MSWLSGFLGALVGAVVGALIAGHYTRLETRQRERAARREEWYRRFEWAASLAIGESEIGRVAGLDMLTALGESRLAGPDEARLLEAFTGPALEQVLVRAAPGPTDIFVLRSGPGDEPPEEDRPG